MELFLDTSKSFDLVKAGPAGGAAVGRDSDKPSRRVARQYNESFDHKPVGVMGGDGPADDPDVGPSHRHSEENSLDVLLEEERQEDNKLSAERGLIPKKDDEDDDEDEDEVGKSLSAVDIVKSLITQIDHELDKRSLNPVEKEFLLDELGYTERDILKGRAVIAGQDRYRFSEWLVERMSKSVSNLNGENL